ncbi:MAG: hypothetical protein H6907_18305 [Hyphomicrobiales bacterium]|nr:hypothetical protein [Hyphomicrobiales bacterium]MCP5373687.1 hypothetical protein [Hyphomicrobiales bacterium]
MGLQRRGVGAAAVAALVLAAGLAVSGCVREVYPSIAHTHIGHALTGWHTTPDKKGLFIVAEAEAAVALEHAGYAFNGVEDLDEMKVHTKHVLHAIDPKQLTKASIAPRSALGLSENASFWRRDVVADTTTGAATPTQTAQADGMPGLGFGMQRAIKEASDHIGFAGTSKDASANIRAGAEGFVANAAIIAERNELIIALGQEVLASNSVPDAAALVEEILRLCRSNVEGVDHDGNGAIGSRPDEYGLKQLRVHLSDMIAREQPPYVPVAEKYLFGLIRLSNGEWAFKKSGGGGFYGYGAGQGGGSGTY